MEMVSFLLMTLFLNETPAEMERIMDDVDKIDCNMIVEMTGKKCFSQCSTLTNVDNAQKCRESCRSTLDEVSQSCKSAQEAIRSVKNMPKDKRERLMKEAAKEDARHVH